MNTMQIAIIGSGNIGGTLGMQWARLGHQIRFGVRDPQSAKAQAALEKAGATTTLTTITSALADADVVLLALPGAAMQEFATTYGTQMDGKIVIDASNRFGQDTINSLAPLRTAAPTALLVRAFNSLGWENFAEPVVNGVQVDLFYCAQEAARSTMHDLIAGIGLNPVLVGDIDQVALVDNLGALWVRLAFGAGMGRRITLKLIGR
jgi:predicted dinucleotide-binding enzyme